MQTDLGLSRSYLLFTLGCVGFFLVAAVFYLGSPGLYYDEVIFAPVSYVIAGEHVPAPIGMAFHGWPIAQQPIYVGAVKAYVMAPVLAFFGSSTVSLRLPMILVGAACLLLLALFLRSRIGVKATAFVLLLAATDPLFIYTTKVDWGPTTLAAFFRCLALGFLFRFFEFRKSKDMFCFLTACAFGFWDKSNFLWFMIAVGIASLVFYREAIWAWLLTKPKLEIALILLPFVFVYLFILTHIVFKSLQIALPAHPLTPIEHIERLGTIFWLYIASASGDSISFFFFGVPLGHPSLVPWLVPFQMLCSLTLLLPVRYFKTMQWRRELCFVSIVILGIYIQAVLTPQTGGPHHMVVFWPLVQIQLGLICLMMADEIKKRTLPKSFLKNGPFAILVAFSLTNIRADAETMDAMRKNEDVTLFRPEITDLSAKIIELNPDKIYSVDWGIGNQLAVLAGKEARPRYEDMWPMFSDGPRDSEHQTWLYERLIGKNKRVAFVSFVEESSGWPEAHASKDTILSDWSLCSRQTLYVPRKTGEPLYRIDLVNACP